jgi:hypothetical protein
MSAQARALQQMNLSAKEFIGLPIPEQIEKMAAAHRRKVKCIELNKSFEGLKIAATWLRENGYPTARHGSISKACYGAQNRAYGYHWEYEK